MQTDMHYYGTYALAHAAGLRADIARMIATASEYVDHSDRVDVVCQDGFEIHAEPTSHRATGPRDQRRTWVPFHFIPANQGTTTDERLICAADSPIARAAVDHVLANLHREFGIPLLGILAHAYEDTFSHYGFSGISSGWNRADADSFALHCSDAARNDLAARRKRFVARYATGPFAKCLAQLGHGSVATLPDEPFLRWGFRYASPVRPSGLRENPKTFLRACRRMHEVFVEARTTWNGMYDDMGAYRAFNDMENAIREILAVERAAEARADAWKRTARDGRLYRTAGPIPDYDSSPYGPDVGALARHDRDFATRTHAYGFLQAADFHRNYMLCDLLPRNGIDVQSAPIEWQPGSDEGTNRTLASSDLH